MRTDAIGRKSTRCTRRGCLINLFPFRFWTLWVVIPTALCELNARPWERLFIDDQDGESCLYWTPYEMPLQSRTMFVTLKGNPPATCMKGKQVSLCHMDTTAGKLCFDDDYRKLVSIFFPFFPDSHTFIKVKPQPVSLTWGNSSCLLINDVAGTVLVKRGYYFRKGELKAPLLKNYPTNVIPKNASYDVNVRVSALSRVCGEELDLSNVKVHFQPADTIAKRYRTRILSPRCDVRGGLRLLDVKYFYPSNHTVQVELIPDEKVYTVVPSKTWTVQRKQKLKYINGDELWKLDDLRYVYACGKSVPLIGDQRRITFKLPANCTVLRFYSLCGGYPLFDTMEVVLRPYPTLQKLNSSSVLLVLSNLCMIGIIINILR